MNIYVTLLFLLFINKIYSFLILSLKVKEVDDCLKSINLDNRIIYRGNDNKCALNENIEERIIPYEIGQEIKFIIHDIGGDCFLGVDVKVNDQYDQYISSYESNFWNCPRCENGMIYKSTDNNKMLCYRDFHSFGSSDIKNFEFYFKIDSIFDLDFTTYEYFYYLSKDNYFFYSPENLDGKINLIESFENISLHAKNKIGKSIKPFFDYIYFKLFFDKYPNYHGTFFGYDDSELIGEVPSSRIEEKKELLKYKLSNEEIKNNGIHLKLKIGIFNEQDKRISELEDFNFYICKKGYQFCDIETSMKCLKKGEGYYHIDGRNYSCYKTCKACINHKRPKDADYFKNYCDICKDEFPCYINMGDYKSCYEKCPPHAPELKYRNKTECISYCPQYKTLEGKCVDYCDYEINKYLLKNISTCYDYIPKNFFIY